MRRRDLFAAALASPFLSAQTSTIRGKLSTGKKLSTSSGEINLRGDEPIRLVLEDERIFGMDFEASGKPDGKGGFDIDPIHTKPMWVYVDGKRLQVSYWCDICYIRTYSPGKCWCCQEYTKFDPKDPATPERQP